jgi:Bcr/CflA subfamily drug resistance transporter
VLPFVRGLFFGLIAWGLAEMTDVERRAPRRMTLVLLSGLSVMSLNLFLPSLPKMAVDFETDYGQVTLSIALYAVATAIVQIVAGPLSDRFGRRPVILWALVIFTLASIGCVFSSSIGSFLAFRMVQAAIITGYSVSLAIVRDGADERKAASILGYLSVGWALAPMLAPILGGALDALFGWRASFWAFVVMGLFLFGVCWFDLRETNTKPSETFTRQFLAYGDLLRSGLFWAYGLCMGFAIGSFYAFLSGIPLVAAGVLGIPPALLGVCMAATTTGFILGSLVTGRYSERIRAQTMILAGRAVAFFGLLAVLLLLVAGIVNIVTVFAAGASVGFANGMTLPAASSGAMSVRRDLSGSAAGLSGALTVLGGAVSSAVTGAVLDRFDPLLGMLAMMLANALLAVLCALYISKAVGRR